MTDSTSPPNDDANQPNEADEMGVDLWSDGENAVTLFLRALFVLLCGGFLAWAQSRSGVDAHAEWNRWIWLSVVANFLLPVFVVWMFFGQGLRHLDWLDDQKLNAWNYGWNWRDWRSHAKWAGAMFALMLPILFYASGDASNQNYYRNEYFPSVADWQSRVWLLASLVIYMACWEWFFRGFLLFGLAQGIGPIAAIIVQAILFGLTHWGKPPMELISSFAGGLILGVVAWRARSFVPAFLTHALIHIAWALLILRGV